MKKIFSLTFIIVFFFTTFSIADSDEFDWSFYKEIQQDSDIAKAAQCAAIDIALYGETKDDHHIDTFAIYLVSRNLEKVPAEMETAYLSLRSFYEGRFGGVLDNIDSKKRSNEILKELAKNLGCHD